MLVFDTPVVQNGAALDTPHSVSTNQLRICPAYRNASAEAANQLRELVLHMFITCPEYPSGAICKCETAFGQVVHHYLDVPPILS